MKRRARKHGTAISTITDPVTGEVLGWTYRWDNGDETRLLKASLPSGVGLGATPVDEER